MPARTVPGSPLPLPSRARTCRKSRHGPPTGLRPNAAAGRAASAAIRTRPNSCPPPIEARINSQDSGLDRGLDRRERAAQPNPAWPCRPRHRPRKQACEIRNPARRPTPARRQRPRARRDSSPSAWQPGPRLVSTLWSFVTSGCRQGRRTIPGPRALDQVQDAREQRVRLSGTAYVDDAGVAQFVGEDVNDQFEHVVVEQAKCAVDEYPGRPLQQDPCDGEAKLLVLTQFPIPSEGRIEQRREAFKAEPVERPRRIALGETVGLQRIGEDFAQGSTRHVGGTARQVEYLFARRARDAPGAPGPQSRQRAKQLRLAGSRRAQNEDAFPGLHDDSRFLELVGVRGGYDLEILDRNLAGIALGVDDAASESDRLSSCDQRMAEIRDSKQRGAPICNGAEIVYEPPQRRLRLGERARRHHEAAERNLSAEIQRRRNEYRSHYRDPTEAGRDPGKIGVTRDDAARRSEHIAKMKLDAAFLVRLTLRQRNVIDVLVDPHQRKAQIGLVRVAFGVAADEAPTDPVAEK